jgi:hypothetical protein
VRTGVHPKGIAMSPLLAASFDANVAFGVFLLIFAFGLVLGFFTVRGSGINNHPWGGHTSAPGAKLPDEFHQFAERQVHDADVRRAKHAHPAPPPPPPPDDMTIDDINRRLAAEAAARKAARSPEAETQDTSRS